MADATWPETAPRADFLAGLVVLEVSASAAGAYAGRLLHLLGADVVRVDLPLVLDCPPDVHVAATASINEGKQAVARADDALHEAVTSASAVVIDCLSDDAADGAVAEYAAKLLSTVPAGVPVIEVTSARGAGGGAGWPRPETTLTAAARGGMSWAIGAPGWEPLTLPFDVPDYLAGTESAAAVALALLGNDDRRWSVSRAGVMAYYVGQISSNFIPYERPWARDGSRATMSGGSYPAAMFPCQDGWISVMCRTQPEWRGLVAALGTPGWSRDERYQDSRVVARLYADDLDPHVEAWTRARTREQVFEAGPQHGFPVAPVLTVGEAVSQEQFRHRGFFTQAPGAPLVPGSPFRTRVAPAAGEPRTDPVGTARPLDGLTILDLSWVWSGPMVTAALADLGARVIKVENRKRADPSRLRGRAFRDGVPVEGPELEVTPYFNQMNRGKHSVEIDMATDEGAELIRRLAKHCDAVVENMRPGVLSKRGLGYAALSAGHPELVMLSLSMLGQTGPLSGIRGYAVVMTGLAGLDSLIGYDEDHLIGSFNPALGDPNGAGHGLAALLAALVKARRTGVGAWIDVSQVEAMVCVLRVPVAQAQTGYPPTPPANRHSVFWPHGVFATSGDDEWIALAARTDAERDRLAGVVGGPKDNREAFTVAVAAWTRARSTPEAVAAVAAIDLPVSEVAPYERMRIDPTLEAVHAIDHRWLGAQDTVSVPWERDGARFRTHRPSPCIGSSTDAVLAELLGLDADEIAGLRERGVLGPDD